MDRRLWYDPAHSINTLTNWDSVTLYLDKAGRTGVAPDTNAYQLIGQLNDWEPRNDWQAAYRGNAGVWNLVTLPFTTETDYRWETDTIGGINNDQNNRGWWLEYHIPFTSLGLSAPPPQGTIWGLALALHDRDSGTGPMNPDTLWPESFSPTQPASWGEMRFGLPTYTQPIPAIQSGVSVIRHKLNGVTVKDVAIGGQFNCGADAYTPDGYFANWGNLRYADDPYFNVQNQGDMSDWPCFSKVLITFPLTSVPASKVIISATLTLHHMGNPGVGWDPGPVPSYIQLLTIDQDWDENTLTWNTTPLARENLGGIWVTPILETPPYPGIPYTWDVSRAVAEAYAAGEPLRLAIYSADEAYHSGRYFYSSDVEDLNATGRPTLSIGWGTPAPSVQARVDPVSANNGEVVTYTLSLLGSGNSMTLTDQLPVQAERAARAYCQQWVSLLSQSTPPGGMAWYVDGWYSGHDHLCGECAGFNPTGDREHCRAYRRRDWNHIKCGNADCQSSAGLFAADQAVIVSFPVGCVVSASSNATHDFSQDQPRAAI